MALGGHPRLPVSDEYKVAWGIAEWAKSIGVSRSYVTALISKGRIESVKLGYKRLITTSPADFVKDLPKNAPHERRGRGRPRRIAVAN
jgi:excisionase family DNA binding protein